MLSITINLPFKSKLIKSLIALSRDFKFGIFLLLTGVGTVIIKISQFLKDFFISKN